MPTPPDCIGQFADRRLAWHIAHQPGLGAGDHVDRHIVDTECEDARLAARPHQVPRHREAAIHSAIKQNYIRQRCVVVGQQTIFDGAGPGRANAALLAEQPNDRVTIEPDLAGNEDHDRTCNNSILRRACTDRSHGHLLGNCDSISPIASQLASIRYLLC